ncbi:Retrovirus-related Pol polyprotein from transposon 412 [Frankliniella fusca]|uniref:RNA-directed DNA polymerase n=1 Tax=Frankliniella fusca TaxID=407009 RepID=A0AAE1HNZ7_9NEOP|nr:Retrovirus-related Pol polyprotein from transposon 412 [Frankliniella fusca]
MACAPEPASARGPILFTDLAGLRKLLRPLEPTTRATALAEIEQMGGPDHPYLMTNDQLFERVKRHGQTWQEAYRLAAIRAPFLDVSPFERETPADRLHRERSEWQEEISKARHVISDLIQLLESKDERDSVARSLDGVEISSRVSETPTRPVGAERAARRLIPADKGMFVSDSLPSLRGSPGRLEPPPAYAEGFPLPCAPRAESTPLRAPRCRGVNPFLGDDDERSPPSSPCGRRDTPHPLTGRFELRPASPGPAAGLPRRDFREQPDAAVAGAAGPGPIPLTTSLWTPAAGPSPASLWGPAPAGAARDREERPAAAQAGLAYAARRVPSCQQGSMMPAPGSTLRTEREPRPPRSCENERESDDDLLSLTSAAELERRSHRSNRSRRAPSNRSSATFVTAADSERTPTMVTADQSRRSEKTAGPGRRGPARTPPQVSVQTLAFMIKGVPKFSGEPGESVNAYLDAIERTANEFSGEFACGGPVMLRMLKMTIRGVASEAFGTAVTTWEQAKEMLRRRFGNTETEVEANFRALTQKKDEAVSDFAKRVRSAGDRVIATRPGYKEGGAAREGMLALWQDTLAAVFKAGLSPQLQQRVSTAIDNLPRKATFEDIIHLACNYEVSTRQAPFQRPADPRPSVGEEPAAEFYLDNGSVATLIRESAVPAGAEIIPAPAGVKLQDLSHRTLRVAHVTHLPLRFGTKEGLILDTPPHLFWIVPDYILPKHAGLLGSDIIAQNDWVIRLGVSEMYVKGCTVQLQKMEVKFAWRTELLKEAGERAEGADVLRFQPGPPTPRPRLSLKRDSTNAAGEGGSGQQDADAVRRTQPETGSPAAAGRQERGAGHQHDGVHAQPAKQSRPEVGQSDAQERSQSSGAEPVRVAPFPSQRSESSQGARAEPPPAPPEPTSSEEGDDDLREDSEEEPASSETGSFTTALSGSELQSERPQGDVRLCLPRKIKLAPGAKVTVAAGDQLLPYQSLSQYTPVLGERGVQVSFVEDHTGMNGQAALQLENFGEETTVLRAGAVLAECAPDSEEERDMFSYFEKMSTCDPKPFDDLFDLSHLEPEVKEKVLNLLREFQDIFLQGDDPIPATPLLKFAVQVDPSAAPVVRAAYRVPQAHEHHMDEELQRMLRHDALEEAAPTTRWFSPVVLVVKETAPGKVKARACIDIRGLNQHCVQDRWPLPRTWDILHQIGGGQFLSCFDAACAFWGVEIEESSRDYFGVITPKGVFRCKRMPFGHKNSASVYCKLMSKVLDMMLEEHRRHVKSYVDDLYLHSDDIDTHLAAMRELFKCVRAACLRLKPDKAQILALVYLPNYKKFEQVRVFRWSLYLSSFDYTIVYKAGRLNTVADALSRALPEPEHGGESSSEPSFEKDILKVAALQVEKDGEYEPVYDEGRFKEEQRRDVTYGPIIAGLEDGQEHANFFLADGLLHRRVGSDGLHAVVVPPTMTDKLVRDFHCPPWAAHASRDRTLSKLRERFWWPGMYTQVLRFTRGCHSCALYKRGTHARPAPLQLPVVPRQPFEAMATDLYGPLPVSSYSGARYVLLAICLHTRWVEAIPLRDQMAPTVARAIVQEIVCRYGCPEYLVSDNGACYSAKLYTEMCRILQVRAIKTTPLHAMSNGVVERANQVMGQALCHYVNEKKHDWEEFLQLVMCSVRSSVSRSTGETPYFSVFHRDMSLPTAALLTPRRVTYADTPALTEKLLQDMSLSTELLRQENIKAKQEGKQYYDRRAGEDVKFYVGQRVYLAVKVKKKGLGRKWRRRYSGPWRIVERLSPTTFKIRTIFEQKPQVYTVHCNRLKHAYEYDNLLTAERRRRRTQDLAEDTDGPDLEALSTSSGSESDVTEPETESRTRRRPAARRGTPGAVVASRGASPAAQQGHTDGDEWTDVEGDPGRGEESSREVTTPAAHATPSTLEHGGLPTPARQGATPAPRRASARAAPPAPAPGGLPTPARQGATPAPRRAPARAAPTATPAQPGGRRSPSRPQRAAVTRLPYLLRRRQGAYWLRARK